MATTPRLGLHLVENRFGQEYFLNRNLELLDVFASRVISSTWDNSDFNEPAWINVQPNGTWGIFAAYPSVYSAFDGLGRNPLVGFYDAGVRNAGKTFDGFSFIRLYVNNNGFPDDDLMVFVEEDHIETLAISGGTPNSGAFRLDIATPGQSNNPTNERQQLQIDATDGTYRLRFNGENTTPLNVYTLGNRDLEIRNALLALPSVPLNSFIVSYRAGNTTDTRQKMTLTPTGTWTGGTFTLGFRGQETSAISWNDTAFIIRSRLLALSTISSVNVSGGPLSAGTPIELDFILPNGPQPLVTLEDNSLTGTTPGLSIAESQASDLRMEIEFINDLGDQDQPLIEVVDAAVSGAGANVAVTLILDGSRGGQVTEDIPWNATAAEVEAVVHGLPNFNSTNFAASGGPLPGASITMTWFGQWDGSQIDVSVDNSTLNAGTPTVTVAQYGGTIIRNLIP